MSTTRSKHAFGSEANVDAALEQGLIDAYDILFLDEKKVGWIDKDGNKVIIENVDPAEFEALETEVASKASAKEVDAKIEQAVQDSVAASNAYVDEKVESAVETAVEAAVETAVEDKLVSIEQAYEKSMYVVSHKPEGTLVDYRDKEIRVMCPADTKWVAQSSGANADPNAYYIGFKAYAPDDAANFKEDLAKTISDETMYSFENNEFAGVEADGRKYSIVWLPAAAYDASTGMWTYHGAKSSADKYVGWYYSVEWYNANGLMIASDCIRVNLSNEDCHTLIEPYYMNTVSENVDSKIDQAVTTANAYTDAQIEAKLAEVSAFEVVEF